LRLGGTTVTDNTHQCLISQNIERMKFVIYLYGDRLLVASMMMTDDDHGSDVNGGKWSPLYCATKLLFVYIN
jgi:hypothetical protein